MNTYHQRIRTQNQVMRKIQRTISGHSENIAHDMNT